jgi:hypothetical protein
MNENRRSHAVIYVPVERSIYDTMIDPGSGIVGAEHGHELVIYYEGNRFGASNMHDPLERVKNAFGRLATLYPTVARMSVLPNTRNQLVRVGEIFWPNVIWFDSSEARAQFDAYMKRYRRRAA